MVVAQNHVGHADCATAFPIGDPTWLHFKGQEGIGKVRDAANTPCFRNGDHYGQAEENATWIYFKIKDAGQFVTAPRGFIIYFKGSAILDPSMPIEEEKKE